jgi:hypothetical protein
MCALFARGVLVLCALSLTGCSTVPDPYMGSPTRGQMITHFDLALELRSYAIWGDVDAFRSGSRELANLNPARDLPAEVLLQLGPMRWEARQGALAQTPEDAARAAAEVARTCGDCHVANEIPLGDRFVTGGPPPGGSVGRHMAGLAWASRLLWDGLVGPSDNTWAVGAEGLVDMGALPSGLTSDVDAALVEDASDRLRRLGHLAMQLTSAERRVELLTEIWTVCAGCHTGAR